MGIEAEINTRNNIEALAESDKRLNKLVFEQTQRINQQDMQIIQLRQELDALKRTVSVLRGG